LLSLALGQVGIEPHKFWQYTFTEFRYLVDHYYHKIDLQTEQTREIIAMLYNVNRGKGAAKRGSDMMKTIAEQTEQREIEIPTINIVDKIKKKYGSKASGI